MQAHPAIDSITEASSDTFINMLLDSFTASFIKSNIDQFWRFSFIEPWELGRPETLLLNFYAERISRDNAHRVIEDFHDQMKDAGDRRVKKLLKALKSRHWSLLKERLLAEENQTREENWEAVNIMMRNRSSVLEECHELKKALATEKEKVKLLEARSCNASGEVVAQASPVNEADPDIQAGTATQAGPGTLAGPSIKRPRVTEESPRSQSGSSKTVIQREDLPYTKRLRSMSLSEDVQGFGR